ncbi:hypothetical protein TNCV_911321 [Trichonephila clavipes]|nr:hypothetical protein TNCV_911321 [Trichonephila clavipes]
MVSQGQFSSKIRLVCMQQELLKSSYVIFRLFHGRLASPDLSPVEHVWDQLKRQMPSCHSVHDLELAVQDLRAHLPQDNIRCLINSMLDRVAACIAAGDVVQHPIEVAQYVCRCTPCIRLIVLFLRSSESHVCHYVY